jgi:hypothetical protein
MAASRRGVLLMQVKVSVLVLLLSLLLLLDHTEL